MCGSGYALPEAEGVLLGYARFRYGVLKIIEIELSHFAARPRSVPGVAIAPLAPPLAILFFPFRAHLKMGKVESKRCIASTTSTRAIPDSQRTSADGG
jgi:hypothetical protein